jgi:hypothetical protein
MPPPTPALRRISQTSIATNRSTGPNVSSIVTSTEDPVDGAFALTTTASF